MRWFDRQFSFGLPASMLPFYIERLEGTIVRLIDKTQHVTEEILSEQWDGKWSIKQNIGHLSEVDDISGKRIAELIQGVPTLSSAVFEPFANYNAMPMREVLKRFEDKRRMSIGRFRNLVTDELQRASLHPRLRVMMTAVDLAWFDAEHDDHHLVTINEILVRRGVSQIMDKSKVPS